jgi:hypothetical protein
MRQGGKKIAKQRKETMVVTCHKIKYRNEAVRTDDIGYMETGEGTKYVRPSSKYSTREAQMYGKGPGVIY